MPAPIGPPEKNDPAAEAFRGARQARRDHVVCKERIGLNNPFCW